MLLLSISETLNIIILQVADHA